MVKQQEDDTAESHLAPREEIELRQINMMAFMAIGAAISIWQSAREINGIRGNNQPSTPY